MILQATKSKQGGSLFLPVLNNLRRVVSGNLCPVLFPAHTVVIKYNDKTVPGRHYPSGLTSGWDSADHVQQKA
jgi:hypothetical protein